jgi:hypothetical protein
MSLFAHDAKLSMTTMSELLRIYSALSPDKFFGCYAYATQSGFRAFELSVGSEFWHNTASRWLFGIDYGRTDPRALREIVDRANTDVRIFDGAWVVDQEGFSPRRDFHAKVAIMEDAAAKTSGVVLGSGNFSYNGLKRSVEAGVALIASSEHESKATIFPIKELFEQLWDSSSPLTDVLAKYELLREQHAAAADSRKSKKPAKAIRAFWIEAGYVTKNRGEDRPGNQIFFPRGFREFFGFAQNKLDEAKNSVIGQVKLTTLVGPPVTNNLRLNRNGMEKMSLPTPEAHGFGVYDGKVLVFEPAGSSFRMSAFESIEFEALYGHRVADIKRMNGGRRYGAII